MEPEHRCMSAAGLLLDFSRHEAGTRDAAVAALQDLARSPRDLLTVERLNASKQAVAPCATRRPT